MSPRVPKHPAAGLWFHSVIAGDDRKREIHWQGKILRVIDGQAVLQLFSWLDGAPTEVEIVSWAEMQDERWPLYATNKAMMAAYEKHERGRGR
jgi:hypothetical protein